MKQIPFILALVCMLLSANSYGGAVLPGPFVLRKDLYPAELGKLNPSYVVVFGSVGMRHIKHCISDDTVTNLRLMIDSCNVKSIRLVYQRDGKVDSVSDFDTQFRKLLTASLSDKLKLKVTTWSGKGERDEFTINYRNHKINEWGNGSGDVRKYWFTQETLYTDFEKSYFSESKVWLLSIGINDYKGVKFRNCESDAESFAAFFEYQADRNLNDSSFKKFVLTGTSATRDSIMSCLDYITRNASKNDYFIFNFSGVTTSTGPTGDTINDQVYFCPYGIDLKNGFNLADMSMKTGNVKKDMLALSALQQKIKFIQADKQMFVVEAGPTQNFRTEFIKGLMQQSDKVTNENRIIMVPNGFGKDNVGSIQKGPINYFITSLDSTLNIYDIFDEKKKEKIIYRIKKAQFESEDFNEEYFNIFFVKEFYKDMMNYSTGQATRGLHMEMDDEQTIKKYASKKVALVVGTDHYNAGWPKLSNPVFDALAIKDELEKTYGYEVKLLLEADMDSIYTAIRTLYSSMDSSSQLVLYFAGHGDFESNLFDDGFIVCHNSKPLAIDPNRDTYIPFSRIRKMINKLPARQILVVIDICYGGTFDNNILGVRERKGANDEGKALNIPAMRRLSTWSKYKTRIVLSSVGNKPALDGSAGKHSPFCTLFLKCLRNNEPGKFLTVTDIYSVLDQQSVSDDVNNKIEPYKGSFGDNEALGEFVFIPSVPLN